jgi:hypothetical protein
MYRDTYSFVLTPAHVEPRLTCTSRCLDFEKVLYWIGSEVTILPYARRKSAETVLSKILGQGAVSIGVYDVGSLASNPIAHVRIA